MIHAHPAAPTPATTDVPHVAASGSQVKTSSQTSAPAPRAVAGSPLSAPPSPAATRATAWRLFITCWIIFALHIATNIPRELFPALALGDHFSFRVDEYAHMHPDLFESPGRGWHIGNNPGVSMLAAIPYAIARPVIDPIVGRVKAARAASGLTEPPGYQSNWPMARHFYAEAWRRGLDIKLGLGALVVHLLFMAPSSALGAVAVFYLLRLVFRSDRTALLLALLYAFGTPVFMRTGFLNHNLMLGHIAFFGFLAMWNPAAAAEGDRDCCSVRTRFLLGGLAGGTAILFDYSGAVFLLGLFAYGLVQRYREASPADAFRNGCWYVLGTLPPVLILWFYQWRAFGHAFYPGQHWMPPVQWIDQGYQGYGGPQSELLWMLAFDYRFGIFVACPLMLLALAAPLVNRRLARPLPTLELWTMLALFAALWIFFAGSNYTRLQFNTGIRYMAPIFPFLFIPAALVLTRLPKFVIYFIALFSLTLAWCSAMYREVERGFGVLDPVVQTFFGGLSLPVLRTLARMQQYDRYFEFGPSPIPFLLLTAAVLYGVWTLGRRPGTELASTDNGGGSPNT